MENIISVHAANREWMLDRPANLEELWDALSSEESYHTDFEDDERLPYWVELWPASIALADWVYQHKDLVANEFCLDMGCGLGLTALAASSVGASVVAFDYEYPALRYAKKNAHINNVKSPLWILMDWRKPAIKSKSFKYIWGGDIMYERRFVTPVLDCLEFALEPGGKVWLAEPNRNVFADFQSSLIQRRWVAKKVHTCQVNPLHVQKSNVGVSLWELSRS